MVAVLMAVGSRSGCICGKFVVSWLYTKFSLVALYRYASDYGNNYRKPVIWLIAVLALFATLLPVPGVGLKHPPSSQSETYTTIWNKRDRWTPNLVRESRITAKAAIAAVDVVAFQRTAEYVPAYPWERVLAILATLVTSALLALFLLAVRREFKR